MISTVRALIRDGQWFLGVTVLVFSIVFPVLKLLYLLLLFLGIPIPIIILLAIFVF